MRRGLDLPPLPSSPGSRRSSKRGQSVWAVTMVKDEADIIGTTLLHLLDQDVDGILVADNGSTDDTRAVIEQIASTAPVYLADDREPAYFQWHKMTRLAHWARRAGAKWVIPFDADELWFAEGDTVAGHLRGSQAMAVRAAVFNVAPSGGETGIGDAVGWVMGRQPAEMSKVAFRPHPLMALSMGNHEIDRPGVETSGLGIAHLPYRSPAQFARKVRTGAAALEEVPGASGFHWRDLGSLPNEDLDRVWSDLLAGRAGQRVMWLPEGQLEPVDVFHWHTWGSDVSLVDPPALSQPSAL
ncbi:glycosyl transferase family 2 [Humibacillus xanthopallidus]|uniref:Glycosyl transferase family 2 n=2 Tax=Humibacillus xanthopallidus TaxID=412689 RepID=A0A543PXH3_9MICO|nr:glycosyl transferase family 2 [Humibacillus xanthopallidus]